MKKIEVFDPSLCCSTGVCGVDVDQALVNFAADANWAKQNGAQVYSQTRRAVMEPDDDTPQAEAKWNIRRADHPNMRETFVLRATNLATGEVCKATLRE